MEVLIQRLKGDRTIWLIVLLLSMFSILAVYSSTGTLAYKFKSGNTEYYMLRHFVLFAFGIGLMFWAHVINFKYFSRVALILLYISIPLLLITMFWGDGTNDADRWLRIPIIGISFQTSDLAKLALIMYAARTLSRSQDYIKDFNRAFLPILIPTLIICGLIVKDDLSTAAMLFLTVTILMFIGRISLIHLGLMIGGSMLVLFMLITIVLILPPSIQDKMRVQTWEHRIVSFLDSDQVSYQTQQAQIAVASGWPLGKGPGNSSQRNFLPHPYSDFIYAIILEEYGLWGGTLMVALYLLLLFRAVKIVLKSPRAFGALLAVGLTLSLVIQAMINMAVAVNLVPVTGQPLPLVSMGGTSLWFTSIAIGIVLSVSRDVEQQEEEAKENQTENTYVA